MRRVDGRGVGRFLREEICGFGISDDGYGMGGLGGSYGGTCTTGGYAVGFVTGSAGSFDRVDALENTLRNCLGLPPLPATSQPAHD